MLERFQRAKHSKPLNMLRLQARAGLLNQKTQLPRSY